MLRVPHTLVMKKRKKEKKGYKKVIECKKGERTARTETGRAAREAEGSQREARGAQETRGSQKQRGTKMPTKTKGCNKQTNKQNKKAKGK